MWLTGPVLACIPNATGLQPGRSGATRATSKHIPEICDDLPDGQGRGRVVRLWPCRVIIRSRTYGHDRSITSPRDHRRLHLFDASDTHLQWTAAQLKAFGVKELVGAHCTGIEGSIAFASSPVDPPKCMVGAVGASYSLDKGINPLRVAK